MATLIVRHTVKDFPKWKTFFDQHAETRKKSGSQGGQLFQDKNNPNDVTVVFQWDSLNNAQAFAQSADLKSTMEKAGVVGAPQVSFLNDAGRFSV